MLSTLLVEVFNLRKNDLSYQLSAQAQALIGAPNPLLTPSLKLANSAYEYNTGYEPGIGVAGQISSARFTASFPLDPKKGATVTDPVNKVPITFKPEFRLGEPRQDQNRLVYPLPGRDAVKVYSLKVAGMKEDIILNSFQGDEQSFKYKLELADGTEARMESDGSLAVYGASPELLGNVSTGSEKDAELLKKARQNSEKNTLLFTFPAPFIRESGKDSSGARAWFGLKGDELTVYAAGLEGASYPLSIDPTVYIETAAKLMRGNNETNVDFDVTNELIQKGKTTGARFDSWTNSTFDLTNARWNHATAVAGGYIYVTGGSSGSSNQTTVYWSKFSTSSNDLQSPNPGGGACTNWCNNSAYNLPAAVSAHSMVAYNGFLYVIGGVDSSCTVGNGTGTNGTCKTVYIAKLGANGEPSLWHPTDPDKPDWVYWYPSTSTLSTERSYTSAVAYNNRLYLAGGKTDATPNGVFTMEYADLKPTGDVGTWSTSGMVTLRDPANNANTLGKYAHNLKVYNDRMYLIGGVSGSLTTGNLRNTVQYIKLASDGTMSGLWTNTISFGTARTSWGGTFTAIWGGYLYVSGGCTTITSSGCSAIAGDTQLASINADGTITDWGSIAGVTSSRLGYGLVAWRNTLYAVGGCTSHNTTSGNCDTTVTNVEFGEIKQDGEASTVSNSVPSGTSPCVTTAWIDCDMPPLGNGNGEGGRMSGGAVINNGFIYYIGGCQAVGNNSVCFTGAASKTSDTISYSAINADGTLTRVATAACPGTSYSGSWCVDNTNTVNGSTGVAAFAYTVFNNVIYVIGGTTGTDWQSNVWRNPLNADGSLGTWTSQTFTVLDLGAAKGYQYAFARANPSSASTYPGNLYVLGGCSGVTSADNGLDCTGVTYTEVYKCNITTTGALEDSDSNDCTTSGQLQIDSEPGTGGSQGLGVMAGTVYANYIYLIGGQSLTEEERGEVMYAKIDNSNNIVAVTGYIESCDYTPSGSEWVTSCNALDPVRRRGVAFGYNGYLYSLAGYNIDVGGSLNDLLFAKIDVSNGSIGTFEESLVTVNARWDLRAIVNNGYVYTLGGCSVGTPPANCTSTTGTIQTFQLYNNYSGSPAGFTSPTGSSVFTTDRLGASSAVLNGYIYIAGGCTVTASGACTTATDNVQYASLDAYGVIGAWNNTTDSTLPAVRTFGQLEAAGGTLYYVGGQSSTATDERPEVYYGTPSSGNISAWNTATNGLPDGRTQHSAAVWNNRIYVTGGIAQTGGAVSNVVYASPSLSAGGDISSAWTATGMTTFNVARSGLTTIAYANNLYIFAGHDGTNYLNDAQFAQINADGTLDSWTYTTSLPGRLRQADGFAVNGFMYLFGGRSDDTACASNTIVAPISANTTIASGNNPTGVGEWFETNIKYTGDRYAGAAVYSEGKAYLLGGGCGASGTLTGANRIVQTTLQSQPQVAKYSRMIDTDTDVFPTSWLLNGLDNSIGAHWAVRYRSMHDLDTAAETNPNEDCGTSLTMPQMTTWGQETNFGDVTLGTVNTYTPLNSSGGNINCARYYYFSVTIDASQTFGYPEDVSRGPTIADLSLFFTADPSKRLKHGKTFTGGEQQPYDTPCRVGASAPGDPNYNCPLP